MFAFFAAFSFFSCSDSEADVVSVSSTLVLDFNDNDSNPQVRLAVFFQLANEAQRSEHFVVTHEESGYSWTVSNPGIFSGLNKNYAYSTNLSVPEGEDFPTGAYSVIYYDAAGNEDEARFSVNYDKEILKSTVDTFRDFLSNSNQNVAVYDEDGELLFMGKAKSSWKTNAAILKDYRLAEIKRVCYVTPGNAIVCMMPSENLRESPDTGEKK
ncbi:MAG: hypothetical protein IJ727_05660 [Treponema sp.]|nr:hypothetical protein [Treponema sp.]